MGLEPTASAVTVRRSNQAELQPLNGKLRYKTAIRRVATKLRYQTALRNFSFRTRAGNRVRTGDLHVGNVTLYQLSYSRDLLTTLNTPTGIRTPVAALRTQNPRPLDDGGLYFFHALTGNRTPVSTLKEWRPN